VAWRHIELVRELALQPTSKLILFALASRANDEGRCWPSIRKVCQDTGLARRTVQLHVGRLTEQGAVMREVRIGRVSGLRLELQALRDVTSSTVHAQESPDCGQPVPEGRIRCIPPAHVTLALTKRSVDFFKHEAKKHNTQYQRMIRRLLDAYAEHHAQPQPTRSTQTRLRRTG
jgi:DNA-binding transcriptional MocR family regulator